MRSMFLLLFATAFGIQAQTTAPGLLPYSAVLVGKAPAPLNSGCLHWVFQIQDAIGVVHKSVIDPVMTVEGTSKFDVADTFNALVCLKGAPPDDVLKFIQRVVFRTLAVEYLISKGSGPTGLVAWTDAMIVKGYRVTP